MEAYPFAQALRSCCRGLEFLEIVFLFHVEMKASSSHWSTKNVLSISECFQKVVLSPFWFYASTGKHNLVVFWVGFFGENQRKCWKFLYFRVFM